MPKPKSKGRIIPGQRGGWRPGAGRKPKGDQAGVSHNRRKTVGGRQAVYATIELLPDLPSLRGRAEQDLLRDALAAAVKDRFRLLHCAVCAHRLHFIVQAGSRSTLSRGVQGLLVRTARRLNRLWGRKGKVFVDRYLDRVLDTRIAAGKALRFLREQGGRFVITGAQLSQRAELVGNA
jgi:hypothetical protein